MLVAERSLSIPTSQRVLILRNTAALLASSADTIRAMSGNCVNLTYLVLTYDTFSLTGCLIVHV